MVNAGEIFHPLRWTPQEALQLLRDVPHLRADRRWGDGCDETGRDGGSRLARPGGTVARPAQRRSHAQGLASADVRVISVSAGTDREPQVLDQSIATALHRYHEAVQRLTEMPGCGIDSAPQVIAEVGASAESLASPEQRASWVGTCPGREASAAVSKHTRSPKGTG